ncbi:MAG: hypothetical protein WCL14_07575 [Bacteroidota bacterium]
MHFGDAIKNKKLLFAIRLFPIILSLNIIVICLAYKIRLQSIERILFVPLLVQFIINLFRKRKD